MSVPKISVIIPAYNAASTILKTIDSVRQQTYLDFEIIVINDGSTDQTLEILNTIQDSRLKIFSYENGGVSVARNRGIAQSVGEFLSFIDADDLWSPDKLELQLAMLESHSEAAVVYSWTRFLNEINATFQDKCPGYTGNVLEPLLIKNFIASGSNIMVRREAVKTIGGFDPEIPAAEDWDFYLRLAAIYAFVVVPKIQIFYHQTIRSASSQVAKMEKWSLRVIERNFAVVSPKLQFLKQQSLAQTYQYSAELYLRQSHEVYHIEAAKKMWKSCRVYPSIIFEREFQDLLKWLIKNWFKSRGSLYLHLSNLVVFSAIFAI